MVVANGRVFVLGGKDHADFSLTIEELSLDGDWKWSMMTSVKMREKRSGFSAVVVPQNMGLP